MTKNIVEKIEPIFEQKIWAGNNLHTLYPQSSIKCQLGEVKLLSPYQCYDDKYLINGIIPIVKLIDAESPLSIQLHPNYSEWWYIVKCKKNASVKVGVKKKYLNKFCEKCFNNIGIDKVLNTLTVKEGDVIKVYPGTIHSIGGGILICEVSLWENITYRIDDFNRIDYSGNTRELHLDKAFGNVNKEILQYKKYEARKDTQVILNENGLSITFINISYPGKKVNLNKKAYIIILDGIGEIINNEKSCKIRKGDSFFICSENNLIYVIGKIKCIIIKAL
ncbi:MULTISPECIES: class I mannose-6-phosphate isomerase [Blautia]|uniref:class I mannose-6-phosphate isomerase n=1 Tax=Blautia TaxID=572511 RepID=UPI000BA40022|nr:MULTISPECIES: class I mannose-6-phosphate isomerase [Blautia]